jgi:hypothetical protein
VIEIIATSPKAETNFGDKNRGYGGKGLESYRPKYIERKAFMEGSFTVCLKSKARLPYFSFQFERRTVTGRYQA